MSLVNSKLQEDFHKVCFKYNKSEMFKCLIHRIEHGVLFCSVPMLTGDSFYNARWCAVVKQPRSVVLVEEIVKKKQGKTERNGRNRIKVRT